MRQQPNIHLLTQDPIYVKYNIGKLDLRKRKLLLLNIQKLEFVSPDNHKIKYIKMKPRGKTIHPRWIHE
jgi:hypothetical protein